MTYSRFGIYFTPPPGAFADLGAEWLGWDIARGCKTNTLNGALVERPQKYGFHATIKPPCRFADMITLDDVSDAMDKLCAGLAPVSIGTLAVTRLGSFLALTPRHPCPPLSQLAARVVRDMDRFRAEPTPQELQSRIRPGMSDALLENIRTWGYPHVMESFRFHMTLTGPVAKSEQDRILQQATSHFKAALTQPVVINSLTLVGEAEDKRFYEISRYDLRGTASGI